MKAKINFDGGCKDGVMGIGAVVSLGKGPEKRLSRMAGTGGTNNIAEYMAVIAALEEALKAGCTEAEVRGDSQLTIRQLSGQYQVRDEKLKPLFMKAKKIAGQFQKVTFTWVPREKNELADSLASEALADGLLLRNIREGKDAKTIPSGKKRTSPARKSAGSGPRGNRLPASTANVSKEDTECPKCGAECEITWQEFKNGSRHLRKQCPEHGFIKYLPQN